MKTHELIAYEDHIAINGNGDYFSWIAEIDEDNKFVLSTHYGRQIGEFSTFRQLLNKIGFNERMEL